LYQLWLSRAEEIKLPKHEESGFEFWLKDVLHLVFDTPQNDNLLWKELVKKFNVFLEIFFF